MPRLPKDYSIDKIKAEFVNGVLGITTLTAAGVLIAIADAESSQHSVTAFTGSALPLVGR